jgi:hypothetical protein
MTVVLTKPLEHDCTHPATEHWISAADDRWHCHVDDCTCSRPRLMPERHRSGAMSAADEQLCHDVDLVSEMRFFGIDAKVTRGGIVIHGRWLNDARTSDATSSSRGDWRPPTDADWRRLRTLLRDVMLHLPGDAELLEHVEQDLHAIGGDQWSIGIGPRWDRAPMPWPGVDRPVVREQQNAHRSTPARAPYCRRPASIATATGQGPRSSQTPVRPAIAVRPAHAHA